MVTWPVELEPSGVTSACTQPWRPQSQRLGMAGPPARVWRRSPAMDETSGRGRLQGVLQRVAGAGGRGGGAPGQPASQRPAAVAGWAGAGRVCSREAVRSRRGRLAVRPSEDSGSNHTAWTAALASRFRAQKPLRTLAVSLSSALGRDPCASCQSRVALQATPALRCNSQPYVHTAALPAPLAAKQPLCLPFWSGSPRKLSSRAACGRLATRDGTASGPRYDEPHAVPQGFQAPQARRPPAPCKTNSAPPSADAIAGRIQQSR